MAVARAAFLLMLLVSPALAQAPPPALMALVTQAAERRGIPPALGHAVATVESRWNPDAVGTAGEVGLMQVMPATAVMLGFRGTLAELADPATNVRLGIQYLGDAWFLTRGDLCTTLMKYRAGHGKDAMSRRSVDYCARVQAYLASVGSPLASELPVLPPSAELAHRAHGLHRVVTSARFWAAWTRKLERPRTRQATRQAAIQ